MSEDANKILETFGRLDPNEQHSVVVSLLKLAGELPSIALSDDNLCEIADELFSSMDEAENGNAYAAKG